MRSEHQKEIFQAMASPEFYPHPVSSVEQCETHISRVFLTDQYVYKVKKAVDLGFLDFTTLEKRRHFCRLEIDLNRRLASGIYLGLAVISFSNGRYFLEGSGTPVEYAVRMRRLADEWSMIRFLQRSEIGEKEIKELARVLSEFYNRASTGKRINTIGSWETIRTNCEDNFTVLESFAGDRVDERMFQLVRTTTRAFLRRRKPLFLNRVEQGNIRDCHGDLRAEHIYFTGDAVQIIDCIEFNDVFRYQDITSDLAFLAMDLDYRGYPDIGLNLLNAYVEQTRDRDVFVLLDFYKCYRAIVRVKVNCLRIGEGDIGDKENASLSGEIEKYMNLAYQYAVQFTRPSLWVVCGLPASGKSTISKELSHLFQIKVFNSDGVRKELFGEQSPDLPFEAGIYKKEASSLTYGRLFLLAQEEIEKGNSVILDAVFANRRRRSEALRLARDKDLNIVFVECASTKKKLKQRLRAREVTPSISDARIHHLDEFLKRFEPLDDVSDEIHIRVDTTHPLKECMGKILSRDYEAMGFRLKT